MDKFEKALAKYREQEEKIADLIYQNQEYKESLSLMLNEHIVCISTVPHLKSDKFSEKWKRYCQQRPIAPFAVKQTLVFTQNDEHYALIIDNMFGIKDYNDYFKTGEIKLLDYNSVFLEQGLDKVSDEIDIVNLCIDRIGTSNVYNYQTVKLDSRQELGKSTLQDIMHNFNEQILNNIKNEKNNPTFEFSNKDKDLALIELNKRTSNLIKKILANNIYEDPEDIMNDDETISLNNINQIMVRNDLLVDLNKNQTNNKKTKAKI